MQASTEVALTLPIAATEEVGSDTAETLAAESSAAAAAAAVMTVEGMEDDCPSGPPPGLGFELASELPKLEQACKLELPPGLLPPPGLELPYPADVEGLPEVSSVPHTDEDVDVQVSVEVGVDAGNPMHVTLHCSEGDEPQTYVATKVHTAEHDSDEETCAGSEDSSTESSQCDSSPGSHDDLSLDALAQPGSILRAAMRAQLTQVKAQHNTVTADLKPIADQFVPQVPCVSVAEMAAAWPAWQSWYNMHAYMPMMYQRFEREHSGVRRGWKGSKGCRAKNEKQNDMAT